MNLSKMFKKEKQRARELKDIEINLYGSNCSLKEILDICEKNNVTNFEGVNIIARTEWDYDDAYSELTIVIKNQPVGE